MLRYHSFYAAHREGEYSYLMDDHDRETWHWVKTFNQYDLYSKDHAKPDAIALRPYYEALIRKYFPAEVRF
jgi:inositol oxygenase